MHNSYRDICCRIAAPPLWWDERGVPRYAPFAPELLASIYAREAALLRIACQACGREFDAAMSANGDKPGDLAGRIVGRVLAYGDPPNVGCCACGPTMTSETRRVLQYWLRVGYKDWARAPGLEIAFG